MNFSKIVEREIKKEFKKLIDKYDLFEIELTNKEKILVLTSKNYFDEQFDHKLMKIFDNFFGKKLYYIYNPNSYGEKELSKHENGLNHVHGINSGTSVPDSNPSEFKEQKCPKCGSVLQDYHVREYRGGDEEFSLICPNCGRVDPSDLIDLNNPYDYSNDEIIDTDTELEPYEVDPNPYDYSNDKIYDPEDAIVIEYDTKKILKEKDIKNLIKNIVEKDINDKSNKN